MVSRQEYDVIVIGGGHAGYEASLASARMGCRTAMVCMDKRAIGRMSCNPSVGGIGKSHIVVEVDALGGEMARNADYTGIQFRTLNSKKGPAVQAARLQCDKEWFPRRIQAVISQTPGLDVIESTVRSLIVSGFRIRGVELEDGSEIKAVAVVLATGTFLSGKIHIGKVNFPGGRIGERAACDLSCSLKKLGFRMGRLKTGTPPRLHKDSLDYDRMEIQPGEFPPPFLSWDARREWRLFHVEQSCQTRGEISASANENRSPSQISNVAGSVDPLRPWPLGSDQMVCWITRTNEKTHEIIQKNLDKSALYGGMITGTGVRYCPSIEDKIVKFCHHDSHHIFIEPEGRSLVEIYPNGTSNSLPEDVQLEMIRSIDGLGKAEFIRPGYAIEYDFSDPTQLHANLETKLVEGLFMAGQINGTTGYEEAGGQGFVAGVNAARKARGEQPIIFSRNDSYLGVMIDDLITKGVDEPYRMFTSRAEHRLILRQDNAWMRMESRAREIGILSNDRLQEYAFIREEIERERTRLKTTFRNGSPLWQMLKRPNMTYSDIYGTSASISPEAVTQLEIEAKYEGYIERELESIRRNSRNESIAIPQNIDYKSIASIRIEAREKLAKFRPQTLGQASRIPGVNPADVAILAVWIERMNHRRQ
jgi:tRNA uridine 5-carboxymethylaminomethyl modification enzyme